MNFILCNDIHSKLNSTHVLRVLQPVSEEEVAAAIRESARVGLAISICGGRHAMGGQQFGEGTLLLDLTAFDKVGEVDRVNGRVEAGAGVKWPELIVALHARQGGDGLSWSIRQKQTGADDLTLGGALAANIHGRGLLMKPIIDDVEAFTMVNAEGKILRCSRVENPEWFRLAIGGYGCFGVITSVCLRLSRRMKLERQVEIITVDRFLPLIEQRIAAGALYGDFQFSIDERSPDFLKRGVFSCYLPVEETRPMPESHNELNADDWSELIGLAHSDRAQVYDRYVSFYQSTHGCLYWSDTHQLSVYLNDYHDKLDHDCGATVPASEMISELYVLRSNLEAFLTEAAQLLRELGVVVIYGTVRLIQKDDESFLPWASQDFACVVLNLHTEHSPEGIGKSAEAFRRLIDVALSLGGSYFLTYHRWARRDQLERAYPQFRQFLAHKDALDPDGRFQSEWWRHHRNLFLQA
ncbi:MAG: FAD-binding oxidoreductase [Akkermansiaceae bacterium]